MKALRVYIDTSVVGGCFDAEFRTASLALFERFRTGAMIAVLSDLVHAEAERAPPQVRLALTNLHAAYCEDVWVTDEARSLANHYVDAGVVSESMRLDARHVATATVHQVDVLASWDFKHMVHPWRAQRFNAVNEREGYPLLAIRTPAEVIGHGR